MYHFYVYLWLQLIPGMSHFDWSKRSLVSCPAVHAGPSLSVLPVPMASSAAVLNSLPLAARRRGSVARRSKAGLRASFFFCISPCTTGKGGKRFLSAILAPAGNSAHFRPEINWLHFCISRGRWPSRTYLLCPFGPVRFWQKGISSVSSGLTATGGGHKTFRGRRPSVRLCAIPSALLLCVHTRAWFPKAFGTEDKRKTSRCRAESQGGLLVHSWVEGVDFSVSFPWEGQCQQLLTRLAQLPSLGMLTMTPRLAFLCKNSHSPSKTQQEVPHCYISASWWFSK